jgi:predicted aldo/keto reductase-like oxidoreductase
MVQTMRKEGNTVMFSRNFPRLGLPTDPSILGFGVMRLPVVGGDHAKIEYKAAEALIDYAYAHGVNYYDTAYVYHHGQSEVFLREALKKYPRDSYYIADKMPGWEVHSPADVERIFAEQQARLGVDYFDFYLCHALGKENFTVFKDYALAYLIEQKRLGKIRRLGFSFHDEPAQLEPIISHYDWDFVQIQLNYFDWELYRSREQYEIVERHGIPAVVMEPVRGGLLAKLSPEAEKILKAYAPNRSVASWAVRYVMSLPNVVTVLSGMSDMSQVTDNVATARDFTPLSDEERAVLGKALDVFKRSITVPCTGCRYCMECPLGVDIPFQFAQYNQFALHRDYSGYKEILAANADKSAALCVSCRTCVEKCPQRIDIPAELEKIRAIK